MSDYETYRSMAWTSDEDRCEKCDSVRMSEKTYVVGRLGHYCSEKCRDVAEGFAYEPPFERGL